MTGEIDGPPPAEPKPIEMVKIEPPPDDMPPNVPSAAVGIAVEEGARIKSVSAAPPARLGWPKTALLALGAVLAALVLSYLFFRLK